MKIHEPRSKFGVFSWTYKTWSLSLICDGQNEKKHFSFVYLYIRVCVCGTDFNWRTKYHHSISKKMKFLFVRIIGECSMVGQNRNKYHNDEIFYIVSSSSSPSSSLSSCRYISTDIPDSLIPPLPIAHCFRQVFKTTCCISTELLYVGSSWSSCLCTSMWRGPQEYITYELASTSSEVSRKSGSSNFYCFRDGRWMAVQLLLYWVMSRNLFNISRSIPV